MFAVLIRRWAREGVSGAVTACDFAREEVVQFIMKWYRRPFELHCVCTQPRGRRIRWSTDVCSRLRLISFGRLVKTQLAERNAS